MALELTTTPTKRLFTITPQAQMPEITVTVKGAPDKATFKWSATLVFDGSRYPTTTPNGSKGRTEHPEIKHTSTLPRWRIPFTAVRGGHLIVKVTVNAGGTEQTVSSKDKNWLVVGCDLPPGAISVFINTLPNSDGASRRVFRKLISHESSRRQFDLTKHWPLYSRDRKGGVGLCQLTNPKPTADQTWDWKANVRGGWKLYQEKQSIARAYPRTVRNGSTFKTLVDAWNQARSKNGEKEIPVDIPDYTPEQLARDTLRGYNGYANGQHEYRVRVNSDGTLHVNVDADGTRGSAEWEVVPVSERSGKGDRDYVSRVLRKADY